MTSVVWPSTFAQQDKPFGREPKAEWFRATPNNPAPALRSPTSARCSPVSLKSVEARNRSARTCSAIALFGMCLMEHSPQLIASTFSASMSRPMTLTPSRAKCRGSGNPAKSNPTMPTCIAKLFSASPRRVQEAQPAGRQVVWLCHPQSRSGLRKSEICPGCRQKGARLVVPCLSRFKATVQFSTFRAPRAGYDLAEEGESVAVGCGRNYLNRARIARLDPVSPTASPTRIKGRSFSATILVEHTHVRRPTTEADAARVLHLQLGAGRLGQGSASGKIYFTHGSVPQPTCRPSFPRLPPMRNQGGRPAGKHWLPSDWQSARRVVDSDQTREMEEG